MSRARNEYNTLNDDETHVIIRKGTERPFTGEYTDWKAEGTFICRRCNAPLYRSDDKFDSGCGWPNFDDELPDSVFRHTDVDAHLSAKLIESRTPKQTTVFADTLGASGTQGFQRLLDEDCSSGHPGNSRTGVSTSARRPPDIRYPRACRRSISTSECYRRIDKLSHSANCG